MLKDAVIIGLELAILAEVVSKKPTEESERKKETQTKIAKRREPRISNSGERFTECPIEGLRSYFEVGDLGTVKKTNGNVLKPFRNKSGKLSVTLRSKSVDTQYTVERLVALAFLARPAHDDPKYHRVLHKNGDIDDNRAVNLMWK